MDATRLFGWLRRPGTFAPGPSRIYVVSTPRTGNTWLRKLLAKVYRLDEQPNGELAVHHPDDVPWADLPARSVLQIHWHHADPLKTLLRTHRFRPVTLVRHPLDVLISILQLSPHSEETARWMDGEGGDETSIHGASPRSDRFLQYATGPRAKVLLGLTPEWWSVPGTLRLRYEDLVADTPGCLTKLTRSLGKPEPGRVAYAVGECTIDRLRNYKTIPHFWQGKPNLWRSLLTANEARKIADAHPTLFARFGYRCDPDPSLTPDQADANWSRLARETEERRSRSAA